MLFGTGLPPGLGLDRGDGKVEAVLGDTPGEFEAEPSLALGLLDSSSIITAMSRVDAFTSVIACFGSSFAATGS